MKKLFALSAAALVAGSLATQAALVGWWNFDDGTANDSSGNGNNGSYVGAVGPSGDVANATAGTGSASFSTVVQHTEHILVPHSSTLDITSAMTITAWVKPENNQWDGIVAKVPSVGPANFPGNYELRTNNGGGALEFGWEHAGGAGFSFTGAATTGVTPNVWSHIAFTATAGGTYSYYVNGVAAGGGAMAANFGSLTNTNPLYIGNRGDFSTTEYHGLIDEVTIWNEELSAAQINGIIANGVPEPSTALLGVLAAMGFVVRRRR